MRFTSLILAIGLAISAGASVLPLPINGERHHGSHGPTPTITGTSTPTGESCHHHHGGGHSGAPFPIGPTRLPIFPLANANEARYPHYKRDFGLATPTGILPTGTGLPYPTGGCGDGGHGHRGHGGGSSGHHTRGGDKPTGVGSGAIHARGPRPGARPTARNYDVYSRDAPPMAPRGWLWF